MTCAAKKGGDQLFDEMDAQDLNVKLKELMDGLSVKVSRAALTAFKSQPLALTRFLHLHDSGVGVARTHALIHVL